MEIIRHDDASLTVPVIPGRHDHDDDAATAVPVEDQPTTRVLHPGQPGYTEALAEWDEQQNPDRVAATSTPTGREDAMAVVHAVAVDPEHDVHKAVEALNDPEPSAEALRHVLVGGDPSIKDFAHEVAEAEGDEQIPTHKVTKIISEVLAEIDT
jgi:hypothetical protein